MSGKNKILTTKGKNMASVDPLTPTDYVASTATDSRGTLTITELKVKLEKNRAAISSEIQASLSPIHLSLDAVGKKKLRTTAPALQIWRLPCPITATG